MNTPNKLTILRILLIPVFVILLYMDFQYNYLCAFIVFVGASFTDALDGYLARKHNQITDFGKFLDPLADKMLTTAAFMCYIDLGLASSIAVLIIIFREFLVTSLRLVASGSGIVIAANIWGKIKTIAQMVLIPFILLMAQASYGEQYWTLNTVTIDVFQISNIIIWVLAGITVLSGITYLWQNREVFLNSK